MKCVLASHNHGKIIEFRHALQSLNIEIIPQAQLQVAEIPEDAPSFIENALLKARHASAQTQLPALADDSGLCVDYLQGAPGVYSARYAGPQKSTQDNMQKLLNNLKDVTQRGAYFYCALAFVKDAKDPTPIIAEGRWYGEILTAPQGETGFGYDPIFLIPSLHKSAAQLSMSEKNALSHRGIALSNLISALNRILTIAVRTPSQQGKVPNGRMGE